MDVVLPFLVLILVLGNIFAQERSRRLYYKSRVYAEKGAFAAGIMFAMDRAARGVTFDRLMSQAKEEMEHPSFDPHVTAEQIVASPSSIFHAAA